MRGIVAVPVVNVEGFGFAFYSNCQIECCDVEGRRGKHQAIEVELEVDRITQ